MANELLRKLSPHLIVGLAGPALTDEERGLLARWPVAGVILFDRNVAGARSLMDLGQDLRRVFRDSRGRVPIVAADHEGGVISVLARAIGVPPAQMAVGRTGDAGLCERLFAENARRMRSCGVNMLLGPVADVNSEKLNPVIGERSFGDDVDLVCDLTARAVSAARREGVLTCLKHFPGHGATAVDSHLALPTLSATIEDLRKRDVRPFARGAAAGAECVMTGHIAPRGRTLPASLDDEIIGGLLRSEIGFEGVVMTDALEMEGVAAGGPGAAVGGEAGGGPGRERRSLAEICRLSIEAGNDILLFSRPVAELASALDSAGVEEAEPFGGDSFARAAAASAERVERLIAVAEAKDSEFELPDDAAIYEEIVRKAVRAAGEGAPVSGHHAGSAVVFHAERGAFERYPVERFIGRVLRAMAPRTGPEGVRAGNARMHGLDPYESAPPAAGLESRIRRGAEGGAFRPEIVVLLNRRPIGPETARVLTAGCRLAIVAGWPYAAELLPAELPTIVTYGISDAAADHLGALIRRGG